MPAVSAEEVVRDFVAAFVDAWPSGDASGLAEQFTEDARYHNIPLEPVVGRAAIRQTFESFMAMGGEVDVDIVGLAVERDGDEASVLTERVDHLTIDGKRASLPLMGIIEVTGDGFIREWRDYFDLAQWTAALSGEVQDPGA